MIGRCASLLAGSASAGPPLTPAESTAASLLREAKILDDDVTWRARRGQARPVEALRADILAHPDEREYDVARDNALRLAYAALTDAEEHARAELIQAQIDRGAASASAPGRRAARVRELIAHHGRGWSSVKDIVSAYRFYRGFVGHVTLSGRDFLERGARLYASEPITEVALRGGVRDLLDEIFASPLLGRLRALDLGGQGIGDAGAARLAASPHVGNLMAVNLDGNRLTIAGLRALASSDTLPRLRLASFAGNLDDLTREASGAELPPLAEQVEEEHGGHIGWLRSGADWLHEEIEVASWLGLSAHERPNERR